jgi:negative regulator of flagellin synthesis FlgM
MNMMIDRVGSVDPIQPGNKSGQANKTGRSAITDSISLSPEVIKKADRYNAVNLAMTAPDIRMDRVKELKEKINDPAYLNEKIILATADKIMDALL